MTDWQAIATRRGLMFRAEDTLPQVTVSGLTIGETLFWMIRIGGKLIQGENLYGGVTAALEAAEKYADMLRKQE